MTKSSDLKKYVTHLESGIILDATTAEITSIQNKDNKFYFEFRDNAHSSSRESDDFNGLLKIWNALSEQLLLSRNSSIKPYEDRSMTDLKGERWLPIRGYKDFYEISNLGRVKSLTRMLNNNMQAATINKQSIVRNDLFINLTRGGLRKAAKVSLLVAETFLPEHNLFGSPKVRHKNHDRYDNRADNLEWFLPPTQEKTINACRRYNVSKLDEHKTKIMNMLRSGKKKKDIARDINVNVSSLREWLLRNGLNIKSTHIESHREQIKELLELNTSYVIIANKLNLDINSLRKWLSRNKLSKSNKSKPKYTLNEHKDEIISLLNEKVSQKFIADKFGVSVYYLSLWRKEECL